MQIPFFYTAGYTEGSDSLELDEDTSRHIIQVLRKSTGDKVKLTDGMGRLLQAVITDAHKRHCMVKIEGVQLKDRHASKVMTAVSLVKNASRFEWFLEKATEIGVNEFIPLLCERTEKEKFRRDRLEQIIVSAMLQSQQCWLPVLHEPIALELLFRQQEIINTPQKFIAHCEAEEKRNPLTADATRDRLILIGPEGDFTPAEIKLALQHDCLPVTLGENRLRTETAALYASFILCAAGQK